MTAFHKILIANRGEIAARIIATAHDQGYQTVAVYSDADANAPHLDLADEAVHLGGPAPADSYLNQAAILEAAAKTGADAVHPGYGFLSENPDFAAACVSAGLVFIGPGPEAVRAMGSKRDAKALMQQHDVPCIPGTPLPPDADAQRLAADIGYPVMIKASAGGGGRGMRRVDRSDQLEMSLQSARAEAKAAFGDDSLLLEKAVENARHVEIQIAVDQHGHGVALGERDCSTQRRHQKVIEEAPCPVMDDDLRRRMEEAALKAAHAVAYVGLGTVEFLLTQSRDFYFLEMNTRLQVEHPVTEMVYDLDLVALQLQIAAGASIKELKPQINGHAVEVRLYAEDHHYVPHTGTIHRWIPPQGTGVRVDHGLREGNAVTAWYDPMLAKIITHGPDRATAVRRLQRALQQTVLSGVTHNRLFLAQILADDRFQSGQCHTGYLTESPPHPIDPQPHLIALAACLFANPSGSHTALLGPPKRLRLAHESDVIVTVTAQIADRYTVQIADQTLHLDLFRNGESIVYQMAGVRRKALALQQDDRLSLHTADADLNIQNLNLMPPQSQSGKGGDGRAVMEGRIVRIHASPGEQVNAGQTVVVMEAMKMEHQIQADRAGTVAEVRVKVGDQVSKGGVLFTLLEES